VTTLRVNTTSVEQAVLSEEEGTPCSGPVASLRYRTGMKSLQTLPGVP
jgi:hypothetical protein